MFGKNQAMRPLPVLHNSPSELETALRMHCVDYAAGLAALVEGSSSVTSGDQIVGLTWNLLRGLKV